MLFSDEVDHDISKEEKEKLVKNKFTMPYICNYIIEVLIYFTDFKEDKTLNLRNYLDSVFIKIVDIWGFTISYLPIFESLFENYNKLNETELELFDTLKKIFIKYLYSPRIKPINEHELTNDFKSLNKILNITNTKHMSSSLKISSSNKSKGVTGKTYLLNYKDTESKKYNI